jgi:hypothetical protein
MIVFVGTQVLVYAGSDPREFSEKLVYHRVLTNDERRKLVTWAKDRFGPTGRILFKSLSPDELAREMAEAEAFMDWVERNKEP